LVKAASVVLKDDCLEDASNLPPRDVIAAESIENLEDALEQFRGVAEELEKTSS
jgi:type I restriction enzyme M protein